jgi:hypothetical protein
MVTTEEEKSKVCSRRSMVANVKEPSGNLPDQNGPGTVRGQGLR